MRLPGRLVRLFVGLIGFGASLAFMVRARLGLGPWDVLHQGIARQTGLRIGWVVIGVSVLVLVLWLPLRQRPGFGTLANALMVGLSLDLTLALLPAPGPLGLRVTWLAVGIIANGAATGLYIGSALGPGPRDGLMTGLARRGYSIRSARTAIELSALGIGWALGGAVGVGTVAYALAIGPLAQYFIPKFTVALPGRTPSPGGPHSSQTSAMARADG
ncbi:MAG: YczE/YyaS/YitT family protein [Actinomycetota bacterium]